MRVRRRLRGLGEPAVVLEEHLEHPAAAGPAPAGALLLVFVVVLLVLIASDSAGLPDDAEVGVEVEVVGERAPEEDLGLRAAVPRPPSRRGIRQHRGDVPRRRSSSCGGGGWGGGGLVHGWGLVHGDLGNAGRGTGAERRRSRWGRETRGAGEAVVEELRGRHALVEF